jgi:hypothetical protein
VEQDPHFKVNLLHCVPHLKSLDGTLVWRRTSLQSRVVNDGLKYIDLCHRKEDIKAHYAQPLKRGSYRYNHRMDSRNNADSMIAVDSSHSSSHLHPETIPLPVELQHLGGDRTYSEHSSPVHHANSALSLLPHHLQEVLLKQHQHHIEEEEEHKYDRKVQPKAEAVVALVPTPGSRTATGAAAAAALAAKSSKEAEEEKIIHELPWRNPPNPVPVWDTRFASITQRRAREKEQEAQRALELAELEEEAARRGDSNRSSFLDAPIGGSGGVGRDRDRDRDRSILSRSSTPQRLSSVSAEVGRGGGGGDSRSGTPRSNSRLFKTTLLHTRPAFHVVAAPVEKVEPLNTLDHVAVLDDSPLPGGHHHHHPQQTPHQTPHPHTHSQHAYDHTPHQQHHHAHDSHHSPQHPHDHHNQHQQHQHGTQHHNHNHQHQQNHHQQHTHHDSATHNRSHSNGSGSGRPPFLHLEESAESAVSRHHPAHVSGQKERRASRSQSPHHRSRSSSSSKQKQKKEPPAVTSLVHQHMVLHPEDLHPNMVRRFHFSSQAALAAKPEPPSMWMNPELNISAETSVLHMPTPTAAAAMSNNYRYGASAARGGAVAIGGAAARGGGGGDGAVRTSFDRTMESSINSSIFQLNQSYDADLSMRLAIERRLDAEHELHGTGTGAGTGAGNTRARSPSSLSRENNGIRPASSRSPSRDPRAPPSIPVQHTRVSLQRASLGAESLRMQQGHEHQQATLVRTRSFNSPHSPRMRMLGQSTLSRSNSFADALGTFSVDSSARPPQQYQQQYQHQQLEVDTASTTDQRELPRPPSQRSFSPMQRRVSNSSMLSTTSYSTVKTYMSVPGARDSPLRKNSTARILEHYDQRGYEDETHAAASASSSSPPPPPSQEAFELEQQTQPQRDESPYRRFLRLRERLSDKIINSVNNGISADGGASSGQHDLTAPPPPPPGVFRHDHHQHRMSYADIHPPSSGSASTGSVNANANRFEEPGDQPRSRTNSERGSISSSGYSSATGHKGPHMYDFARSLDVDSVVAMVNPALKSPDLNDLGEIEAKIVELQQQDFQFQQLKDQYQRQYQEEYQKQLVEEASRFKNNQLSSTVSTPRSTATSAVGGVAGHSSIVRGLGATNAIPPTSSFQDTLRNSMVFQSQGSDASNPLLLSAGSSSGASLAAGSGSVHGTGYDSLNNLVTRRLAVLENITQPADLSPERLRHVVPPAREPALPDNRGILDALSGLKQRQEASVSAIQMETASRERAVVQPGMLDPVATMALSTPALYPSINNYVSMNLSSSVANQYPSGGGGNSSLGQTRFQAALEQAASITATPVSMGRAGSSSSAANSSNNSFSYNGNFMEQSSGGGGVGGMGSGFLNRLTTNNPYMLAIRSPPPPPPPPASAPAPAPVYAYASYTGASAVTERIEEDDLEGPHQTINRAGTESGFAESKSVAGGDVDSAHSTMPPVAVAAARLAPPGSSQLSETIRKLQQKQAEDLKSLSSAKYLA